VASGDRWAGLGCDSAGVGCGLVGGRKLSVENHSDSYRPLRARKGGACAAVVDIGFLFSCWGVQGSVRA
jgi:hypothetical protein